jgi:hypothetical protein
MEYGLIQRAGSIRSDLIEIAVLFLQRLNESFFWPEFETKTKARDAILKWIKWNNTERLHSSLGYVGIMVFKFFPDNLRIFRQSMSEP